MTLLDDSFGSIVNAIMWGRSLYRNIQRFLFFQLVVNVAALMLVLGGAVLGTELPLTVTQILWVNLIMDTFAAMALASLPPSKEEMAEGIAYAHAQGLAVVCLAELCVEDEQRNLVDVMNSSSPMLWDAASCCAEQLSSL